MNPLLHAQLADELSALDLAGRQRFCPPVQLPDRIHGTLAEKAVVSFCTNDYLGLAAHPEVAQAAIRAIHDHGLSASSSRLVAGDHPLHHALETELAALLSAPTGLLFPSGYQANLGVITALTGPQDLIVSDAANHASLIDGCRLSRARVVIYQHADADAALQALRTPGTFRRRILVTESLFSMDGDLAPLPALAAAAEETGAFLVVDEAHAVGVIGAGGAGHCHATGVKPDFLIATLGKALASAGGFVATSPAGRSLLVNRARSFIYTTALSPAAAAAGLAALRLARDTQGDECRQTLGHHAQSLRSRLGLPASSVSSIPILPIILGSENQALAASARLLSNGLFVQAIRPPTVPAGTSRLRITLSARHTFDEIDRLIDSMGLK